MNLLDRWSGLLEPFGFSARYVKWSFLCVVSALLENRCWLLDHGGDYIYPTLYTLLVGAPATYKTSTCNKAVLDLLTPIITDAEGPYLGPRIATPAGLIRAFERSNQKNTANEFKSSPLFIYAPEWHQFYADIGGGTLIRDLLGFYDPMPPGHKFEKEIVKDSRPHEIVSPALTILGCTTQRGLLETRMMTHAGNGIASRFIFVHEPGRPRGTSHRLTIRDAAELRVIQASCQVIRGMRGPFSVTPDADARLSHLVALNSEWNRENPAETLFSHYMARRPTQLKKLAMLLSACSRATRVIELADVDRANALLVEIEPDIPHAFGLQIIRNDSMIMEKLLSRIRPEGTTEAELLHQFTLDGQIVPKDTAYYDALDGLIALNWVVKHVDPTSKIVIFKNTGVKK